MRHNKNSISLTKLVNETTNKMDNTRTTNTNNLTGKDVNTSKQGLYNFKSNTSLLRPDSAIVRKDK